MPHPLPHPTGGTDRQLLIVRIEDNLRRAVTGAVGGTLNAIAACLTMLSSPYPGLVLGWLGCILVVAGFRLSLVFKRRREGWQDADPDRDLWQIHAIALINGILWGTGIAAAASVADIQQFSVLAILSGGMVGASVLTYSTMAIAAMMFMAPICLGTVVAWALFPGAQLWIGALFCTSYLLILSRGAFQSQREFAKAYYAREELREAGATVQLLLNDFEAQSADWLWKVDADGRIIDPSPRFGDAARRAWQLLENEPLTGLFEPCRETERLSIHLAQRTPFRDLTLPLTLDGSPHWWTLSAQPWQQGMRGVARDVTAQKRAEARVSHMAHYDGLTNLANRFLFNETLAGALLRRRSHDHGVAVLYLDLDRFKAINDTLGHPVGDKLLCEIARRIESCVRKDDLVARLGGDEFAVLMHGRHVERIAEKAAQRIIESVRQPCLIDDGQVLTSTSIGIAISTAEETDAATLMKQADLALYVAKGRGRGVFSHFEPGMDEAATLRRELEMDLRTALTEGQFELHYQPLIDVRTRQTVAYEALVRWHHPTRGMVMPDLFISLAEETGLVVPLGDWVIRRACQQMAHWPDHLRIAVNLSPAQLRSAGLISTVMQAIAENGIKPNRLELEITENVLLKDNAVHAALLHRLRSLGVRVALDDFGTGYSSLNYLRAFPFDKIKIDRCFLKGLGESNETLPIVRAVIALAHAMGMTTTAEGVENEHQMHVLLEEGCDQAQGFLFSRAMPADHFPELQCPPRAMGQRAKH